MNDDTSKRSTLDSIPKLINTPSYTIAKLLICVKLYVPVKLTTTDTKFNFENFIIETQQADRFGISCFLHFSSHPRQFLNPYLSNIFIAQAMSSSSLSSRKSEYKMVQKTYFRLTLSLHTFTASPAQSSNGTITTTPLVAMNL